MKTLSVFVLIVIILSTLFWDHGKFKTREEKMGGELYWMIYKKYLGQWHFYERWNTPETAKIRLKELTKKHEEEP